MVQGTGSDVWQSRWFVAGLARAYANRGLRVAPFKPQNMSNNAAVTAEGGEIGRAPRRFRRARRARWSQASTLNPVPAQAAGRRRRAGGGAGKVIGRRWAREYQSWKPTRLMRLCWRVSQGCAPRADLILIEGAGSAAELICARATSPIWGFARAVDAPVVLVADIDRGGVIAQLVGCQAVIEPSDAALIKGFIVNKFRGDPSLFDDGMAFCRPAHRLAAAGTAAVFSEDAARLPAEDAFGLRGQIASGPGGVKIAVPLLPNIANFDDLDPLKAEPGVSVVFVPPGTPLPGTRGWSSCRGRRRPSPILWPFAPRAGISILPPIYAGRARAWRLRRLSDVGTKHRRFFRRRSPQGETEGLGLLDVGDRAGGAKEAERDAGRERRRQRAVQGL